MPEILDNINILIVFTSLLLTIFLLTVKAVNKISNVLLSLFLITNALDGGSQFVGYIFSESLPEIGLLIRSLVFLKMPLLYLYILSIIFSNFSIKRKHLLHLIPFIMINIILIPRYYGARIWGSEFLFESTTSNTEIEIKLAYIILHLQIIAYLVAGFIAIKRYHILLLENFSDSNYFNHKWLFQLLLIFGIESLIASTKNVFMFLNIESAFNYTQIITSLIGLAFIIWIVQKALHSPNLFRGIDLKTTLSKDIFIEKKETVSIEEKDNAPDIQNKIIHLEEFMKVNEPFLDPSLTIYSLAKLLNIPPNELSVLINRNLNTPFFSFINGYRIKKAMDLLRNPEHNKLTILEILYKVGFNSKSSFNTSFKKITNQTPSEYRKTHSKSEV
jgi:AraC-like DNA-binding protein